MYPSYHLENDWMPDYNRGLDELYKLPYDDTTAAQYLYGPARSRPTQPTNRPTTARTTESPTQNCQWSNWSSYSTCSVTCGNGSKSRTRICENLLRRPGSYITFSFLLILITNPRKGAYHVIVNAADRMRKSIIVIMELVIPLLNHP